VLLFVAAEWDLRRKKRDMEEILAVSGRCWPEQSDSQQYMQQQQLQCMLLF
jgi:hypothetical protein